MSHEIKITEPTALTHKGDLFHLADSNEVLRVVQPEASYKLATEWGMVQGLDADLYCTPAGVEKLAETAKAHYEKLREFGADVPSQTYEISNSRKTIFTTTEFIASSPVNRTEFPLRLATDRMISPIVRYHAWLQETSQPFGMLDLVSDPASPYYKGENWSVSNDGKRLFLHDTPVDQLWPTNSLFFIMGARRELMDLNSAYLSKLRGKIPDDEFDQLMDEWSEVTNETERRLEAPRN